MHVHGSSLKRVVFSNYGVITHHLDRLQIDFIRRGIELYTIDVFFPIFQIKLSVFKLKNSTKKKNSWGKCHFLVRISLARKVLEAELLALKEDGSS